VQERERHTIAVERAQYAHEQRADGSTAADAVGQLRTHERDADEHERRRIDDVQHRGGDGDEMDRSLRRRRDRPDVFPVFDAGIYTGSWKKGHPDSFWDLCGSLPLHSGSDLCAVVPVIPDAARRASAQKNVGQPGFDADIP